MKFACSSLVCWFCPTNQKHTCLGQLKTLNLQRAVGVNSVCVPCNRLVACPRYILTSLQSNREEHWAIVVSDEVDFVFYLMYHVPMYPGLFFYFGDQHLVVFCFGCFNKRYHSTLAKFESDVDRQTSGSMILTSQDVTHTHRDYWE